MSKLRIAIAQLNVTVGDLVGNVARIQAFAARAQAGGAHVLLTPELALCGYPPEDLLLRPDFYRACHTALNSLAQTAPLPIIVGHPLFEDNAYNAASLLMDGRIVATYRKHRLPNYEVFDEERYFAAGDVPCVVELNGVRCGLAICADVWEAGAAEAAVDGRCRIAADAQRLAIPSWIQAGSAALRGAARAHYRHGSPCHLRQPGGRPG
jgi:predicted amidohydrolase